MATSESSGVSVIRKSNWTITEVDILVKEVTENISLVKGKFSCTLTAAKKAEFWQKVTEIINSSGEGSTRTIKDVKKKWQDLQSSLKKKEATRKREVSKTGGGSAPPAEDLKSFEHQILSVLSSNLVEGIGGSYYSFDTGSSKVLVDSAPSRNTQPDARLTTILEREDAMTPTAEDDIIISCAGSSSSSSKPKLQKRKYEDRQTNVEKESFQAKILKLEERKIELMEMDIRVKENIYEVLINIANSMKTGSESPLTLSPVIKFN